MIRESRLSVHCAPGTIEGYSAALNDLISGAFARRLHALDAELFGTTDGRPQVVARRLGWLGGPEWLEQRREELSHFASTIESDGFHHVVLLGMGGSSLCPEVLAGIFGVPGHLETFDVVDSTAPDFIARVEGRIDPAHTLFVVASKSGSTVETRSQADYFFDHIRKVNSKPGLQFVAITDPDSGLQLWAEESGFRHIFRNPAEIGGRYSALSYFGMVPAALLGVALKDFSVCAGELAADMRADDAANPALALGALMGAAAQSGRDKLTFVTSAVLTPVVPWIEQLIAESTGKEGRGIVPIEAEPARRLTAYGEDRLFCLMRMADDSAEPGLYPDLLQSPLPLVEIVVPSRAHLGALFLLWEIAVSAAGRVLDINPYDEPNVKESKDNTHRILEAYDRTGEFPDTGTPCTGDDYDLWVSGIDADDPRSACEAMLREAAAGSYLALLYFGDRTEALEGWLHNLREITGRVSDAATLRGYGPRYLHSIGQLYKGGPPDGRFVVFTADSDTDRAIPDRRHTFGALLQAQALGDYEALAGRGRPVMRVHLKGDARRARASFAKLWEAAAANLRRR